MTTLPGLCTRMYAQARRLRCFFESSEVMNECLVPILMKAVACCSMNWWMLLVSNNPIAGQQFWSWMKWGMLLVSNNPIAGQQFWSWMKWGMLLVSSNPIAGQQFWSWMKWGMLVSNNPIAGQQFWSWMKWGMLLVSNNDNCWSAILKLNDMRDVAGQQQPDCWSAILKLNGHCWSIVRCLWDLRSGQRRTLQQSVGAISRSSLAVIQ